MTIKEFAKSKGVSGQAVYQRLKAKGISVSSLVNGDTKQLTAFGLDTLNDLYSQVNAKKETIRLNEQEYKATIEKLQRELDEANKKCQSLNQAAELMSVKLTAAEDRANKAESNADRWYAELEKTHQLLLTAQAEAIGFHPVRDFFKGILAKKKKDS